MSLLLQRGMKRKQHNFDTDFLNKRTNSAAQLRFFKDIFVNRWNALNKDGVALCCDTIMALEHYEAQYDTNGMNRNFFKTLDKMRCYRPVVYGGDTGCPVHTQEKTGKTNTVNVRNTGTGDLHSETQIGVIPPICKAPRYTRLSSKNSSDEVYVLQTVNRTKYTEHIRSLLQTVQIIRGIFDMTDVDVSGGYKRRNGDVAGQPSRGLADKRLQRAQIEFQASIEHILNQDLRLNPLWMDISACVLAQAAAGCGSLAYRKSISNFDIFRCALDASSDWFGAHSLDDNEDILSGMAKAMKDRREPEAGDMATFLDKVADNTDAPLTIDAAKEPKLEFHRSQNYIVDLGKYNKLMYAYTFMLARFIAVFELPKIGEIRYGNDTTFTQNHVFSTTLCSDV